MCGRWKGKRVGDGGESVCGSWRECETDESVCGEMERREQSVRRRESTMDQCSVGARDGCCLLLCVHMFLGRSRTAS